MRNFCRLNNFQFWRETKENELPQRYALATNEPIEYDKIIPKIQKFLDTNDVCVIIEAGHEKLSYVVGVATIITKYLSQTIELSDLIRHTINSMDLPYDVKNNFKFEY